MTNAIASRIGLARSTLCLIECRVGSAEQFFGRLIANQCRDPATQRDLQRNMRTGPCSCQNLLSDSLGNLNGSVEPRLRQQQGKFVSAMTMLETV